MFGGIAKSLIDALVATVAGRVIQMLKIEVENAKIEIQTKVRGLTQGLAVVAIGASFAFFAIGAMITAAIVGLSYVWPLWLSALVVGAALLLIAGILAWIGGAKVQKNKNLVPEKSIANIKGLLGR